MRHEFDRTAEKFAVGIADLFMIPVKIVTVAGELFGDKGQSTSTDVQDSFGVHIKITGPLPEPVNSRYVLHPTASESGSQ